MVGPRAMPKRSKQVDDATLDLFNVSDFTVESSEKPRAGLFGEPVLETEVDDDLVLATAIDAQYLEDLERSYQLMVTCFKIGGLGITEIAITLSLDPHLKLEQYRYLMGGIITQRSMWADKLQGDAMGWLRQAVYLERLAIVIGEMKTGKSDEMASPVEVLAVLTPAINDAPLQHRWSQVYLYCANWTLGKYKLPEINANRDGQQFEDFWEYIGMGSEAVEFHRIRHDYNDLALDIRRKVVNHAANAGIDYRLRKQYFRKWKDEGKAQERGDRVKQESLL